MTRKNIISTALLIIAALAISACGQNFSNGERVGVITKLSHKGLIWKSWEGEMLVALPVDVAGATNVEKFRFNVDEAAVEKVKAAASAGKRVTLVYRQWALPPLTIENDHVVIDVR